MGPRGQFKIRHRCIVGDLGGEFEATEGPTEHSPLVFGAETALWSHCSKKGGGAVPGALEAAERFMVKWNEDEAKLR